MDRINRHTLGRQSVLRIMYPINIIPLLRLTPWLAVWIGSTPLLTRVTTLGIDQIRKTRPLKTHFIIGLILVLLGLALLDIPIHYFGIYSIDYLILNPLQPIATHYLVWNPHRDAVV